MRDPATEYLIRAIRTGQGEIFTRADLPRAEFAALEKRLRTHHRAGVEGLSYVWVFLSEMRDLFTRAAREAGPVTYVLHEGEPFDKLPEVPLSLSAPTVAVVPGFRFRLTVDDSAVNPLFSHRPSGLGASAVNLSRLG